MRGDLASKIPQKPSRSFSSAVKAQDSTNNPISASNKNTNLMSPGDSNIHPDESPAKIGYIAPEPPVIRSTSPIVDLTPPIEAKPKEIPSTNVPTLQDVTGANNVSSLTEGNSEESPSRPSGGAPTAAPLSSSDHHTHSAVGVESIRKCLPNRSITSFQSNTPTQRVGISQHLAAKPSILSWWERCRDTWNVLAPPARLAPSTTASVTTSITTPLPRSPLAECSLVTASSVDSPSHVESARFSLLSHLGGRVEATVVSDIDADTTSNTAQDVAVTPDADNHVQTDTPMPLPDSRVGQHSAHISDTQPKFRKWGQSTEPTVDFTKFSSLIELLREMRQLGDPCPKLGAVSVRLLKKDPEVFDRAGLGKGSKMRKFSNLAMAARIVIVDIERAAAKGDKKEGKKKGKKVERIRLREEWI
jgi:hypothetical protein